MQGLDEVKDEVHVLGKEIAGLRPLVYEVHANMPRIANALETLARVTERLESNTEDHKRIHFRITDNEDDIKQLGAQHAALERKFIELRDEHIICTTANNVRLSDRKSGLWMRLKEKGAEKTLELVLLAVFGFIIWLVIYHLPKYPVTASMLGGSQ